MAVQKQTSRQPGTVELDSFTSTKNSLSPLGSLFVFPACIFF